MRDIVAPEFYVNRHPLSLLLPTPIGILPNVRWKSECMLSREPPCQAFSACGALFLKSPNYREAFRKPLSQLCFVDEAFGLPNRNLHPKRRASCATMNVLSYFWPATRCESDRCHHLPSPVDCICTTICHYEASLKVTSPTPYHDDNDQRGLARGENRPT